MQQLVEAAGHSLAAKATAYISTFATAERLSRPVITSDQVIAALKGANGVKSEAAKSLNISRQALYRLLAKCEGIQPVATAGSAVVHAVPAQACLGDYTSSEHCGGPLDDPARGQLSLLGDLPG
jgi:hypothetical protein